jgi:hypothetical protein
MEEPRSDQNEELKRMDLPEAGQQVLVQCEGFRCIAYLTADGKWKSALSDKEIKVLHVISRV